MAIGVVFLRDFFIYSCPFALISHIAKQLTMIIDLIKI